MQSNCSTITYVTLLTLRLNVSRIKNIYIGTTLRKYLKHYSIDIFVQVITLNYTFCYYLLLIIYIEYTNGYSNQYIYTKINRYTQMNGTLLKLVVNTGRVNLFILPC